MMKFNQAGTLEDLAVWIDPLTVVTVAESNSANGRFALIFVQDRDEPFRVAGEAETIATAIAAAKSRAGVQDTQDS